MSDPPAEPAPRSPSTSGSAQLRELVALCLERFEAEGQSGVDAICRDHPDHAETLRRRIDYLRRVGLLEGGPAPVATMPEVLGDFRLLRKLGEGGMGVVYLAEQRSLKRAVALKLVRPEQLLFAGARERFRREVDAVVRLQHPAIVPIHAVGEELGVPWFAMQWIVGCSLGEVLQHVKSAPGGVVASDLDGGAMARAIAACKRDDQSTEESDGASAYVFDGSWTDACFRLVRQVADALDHAHRRGVLHRDLKPSNIMVTPSGRALLVDFGLAMTSGTTRLTRTGALLGSLPYLAPEQLGSGRAIDERTDVYGLGVTLFELLTLRVPFTGESTEATIRAIEVGTPARVREHNRAVPADAETVCLRAMERDPAHRYASVADFARDLDNVLQRRPIEARRASAWRRTRDWTRRHPAWAVALVLGSLLVVGGPLAFGLLEERNNRRLAAAFENADGLRLSAQSVPFLATDPGLALLLAIEGARRRPGLVANNALLAALAACHEEHELRGHDGAITKARFSPDGRRVATASVDGTIRLWDAESGESVRVLRGHASRVNWIDFDRDGKRLVSASNDKSVRVWEVATGALLVELLGHEDVVSGAVFDGDGGRVLSWSNDRTARLWSVAERRALMTFGAHDRPVRSARLNADGSRVATVVHDPVVRVFDTATGRIVHELRHEREVDCAEFSFDGTRLATGGVDHCAHIYDVASGEELVPPLLHELEVWTIDWSRDGTRLLTGGGDHVPCLWDAQTGEKLLALRGPTKFVRRVRISPDGRQLLTGGDEFIVQLWDAKSGQRLVDLAGNRGAVNSAEFSPDGRRVVTSSIDARIWTAASERQLHPWEARAEQVRDAALSNDGARFATSMIDGTARIGWVASGRLERTLRGHSGSVISIEFSRDDRRVVTASVDATARVFDFTSASEIAVLKGHEGALVEASFDRSGERVVTSGTDHTARIFDVASGKETTTLRDHRDVVTHGDFSPDGRQVVTACRDGCTRVFETQSGACIARFEIADGHGLDARFSPDGGRIVVGYIDATARVFDVAKRSLVATLRGHDDRVVQAIFSPDGTRIVTCSPDRTARVWDAQTGEEQETLDGHSAIVRSARFDADGRVVTTISLDGNILRWPVDPLAAALAARPRELTERERATFGLVADEPRSSR